MQVLLHCFNNSILQLNSDLSSNIIVSHFNNKDMHLCIVPVPLRINMIGINTWQDLMSLLFTTKLWIVTVTGGGSHAGNSITEGGLSYQSRTPPFSNGGAWIQQTVLNYSWAIALAGHFHYSQTGASDCIKITSLHFLLLRRPSLIFF